MGYDIVKIQADDSVVYTFHVQNRDWKQATFPIDARTDHDLRALLTDLDQQQLISDPLRASDAVVPSTQSAPAVKPPGTSERCAPVMHNTSFASVISKSPSAKPGTTASSYGFCPVRSRPKRMRTTNSPGAGRPPETARHEAHSHQ